MNHRYGTASVRSPIWKEDLVVEKMKEEACGYSLIELRPKKKTKGRSTAGVSDFAADRSGMKSTAVEGRSKIFIRIRTKDNEETADVATTISASATDIATVNDTDGAAMSAIDADIFTGERISGGDQEALGLKIWNLRPRKQPTKKRSNGNSGGNLNLKRCSGSENKTQGTVRTESIRSRSSRNSTDVKIATTERTRLSISLSKMEIEEDIYALTGSKPSKRPKKRAKNVQKQLDILFPGLWIDNISSDAYKVSEHS